MHARIRKFKMHGHDHASQLVIRSLCPDPKPYNLLPEHRPIQLPYWEMQRTSDILQNLIRRAQSKPTVNHAPKLHLVGGGPSYTPIKCKAEYHSLSSEFGAHGKKSTRLRIPAPTSRSVCGRGDEKVGSSSSIYSRLDSRHAEPGLRDFIKSAHSRTTTAGQGEPLCNCDDHTKLAPCSKSMKCQYRVNQVPVYIRTYGCQMNVNDTSIIASILQDYGYEIVSNESNAEIELLVTCAIRESAEGKIWSKLRQLKRLKNSHGHPLRQVGLLGCMAERLKQKVLETDNSVDIVAGPDAYRDLPRLFAANRLSNEKAINCLLSFDETYSDIRPVTSINAVTSFISITRGCDNLCSYCVVPFTRGRERSRPLATILDEIKVLMERGIKEVTLLGQNVNSYRDLSTSPQDIGRDDLLETVKDKEKTAIGFRTVYKPRVRGLTFDVLLEEVAKISPELRIRFTSPHPKDFTNEVIDVMRRYPNIARCIHLPAQSGSTRVLERMRRGYTSEAYLDLVGRLRAAMPDLAITSDFIAGFCGETDEDHRLTIELMKKVEYSFVYSFPYSERTKTHAYHKMADDVPQETKNLRVAEILAVFRDIATRLKQDMIGQKQLVLVELDSSRSNKDWQCRNDQNVTVIIPKCKVPNILDDITRPIKPGDYVVCRILEGSSQTLKAEPLYVTTQLAYHETQAEEMKQKSTIQNVVI